VIYIYWDKNGFGQNLAYELNLIGCISKFFTKPEDVGDMGLVYMHPTHLPLDKREKDKAIMAELAKRPRLRFIPTAREIVLYDDKIAQYKAFGNWLPPTFLAEDKKAAMQAANKLKYPLISKSKQGAGATNARLINTPEQAKREIYKVFSEAGLECYENGVQKGYVLWQKFIPNMTYNWRVLVLGYKYFVITKRWNEKETQFVNDKGKIKTSNILDKQQEKIITFAERFARENKFVWAAVDVVEDGDKMYVLETSTGWPAWWFDDGMIFERTKDNKLIPMHYARHVFKLVAELLKKGEMPFRDDSPIVLWLYDVEGWAYEERMNKFVPLLKDYNHRCYSMKDAILPELQRETEQADVVMSMFHAWIESFYEVWNKTIVGVTGTRALIE